MGAVENQNKKQREPSAAEIKRAHIKIEKIIDAECLKIAQAIGTPVEQDGVTFYQMPAANQPFKMLMDELEQALTTWDLLLSHVALNLSDHGLGSFSEIITPEAYEKAYSDYQAAKSARLDPYAIGRDKRTQKARNDRAYVRQVAEKQGISEAEAEAQITANRSVTELRTALLDAIMAELGCGKSKAYQIIKDEGLLDDEEGQLKYLPQQSRQGDGSVEGGECIGSGESVTGELSGAEPDYAGSPEQQSTRASLSADVDQFLAAGGRITQVAPWFPDSSHRWQCGSREIKQIGFGHVPERSDWGAAPDD